MYTTTHSQPSHPSPQPSQATHHQGLDFDDAKPLNTYDDPIPVGTVARVVMIIKPGGYDDQTRQWTGGFATYNTNTGSVYLNCEFTVKDGPYAGRKLWALIGLYSSKGTQWFEMGRSFIRAALNSAKGFTEDDNSTAAKGARHINSFGDLNGLEFVVRIGVEQDKETGKSRNIIKTVLTKDHKDFAGHDSGYYAGTAAASLPSSNPAWNR